MGTRTSHPPGTFSWVDLQTTDLEAAKDFYSGLLGWEFEDMPAGDGNIYSMARIGGEYVSAASGLPAEGIPPHWNSYVTVDSADDVTARVGDLGGTVIEPPFDVLTAGRMALFTDPSGAMLCIWEPRDHIGAGRVNDPGTLTWNELGTKDPEAAATFFSELFGWTYDENDMGGGEVYRTIRNGERMNGGIRRQIEAEKDVPPNWLPYFVVEDADATAARATELGGQIMQEPFTLPFGAGSRIAVFADPQGAVFAVFAGETED